MDSEDCGAPHPADATITCTRRGRHRSHARGREVWPNTSYVEPPPQFRRRPGGRAQPMKDIAAFLNTGAEEIEPLDGTEQFEGFDLDPVMHARREDPPTSHRAAAELSDQTSMMYRLLTSYGWADNLTAEEASLRAGLPRGSETHKRVSDLKNLGMIEDTGETRIASTRRQQMVCAITEAGASVLG